MDVITPDWIQVGELGLAFVVIILCTWLVVYVMKTSASRETMLMTLIRGQGVELSKLTETITQLSHGVGDIVDRLETLENKVMPKSPRRTRKVDK